MTPATDCDFSRDSYVANGDGYGLTTALMRWFWNHYADEAARTDPKASPLRATDLSGLPPALVVTCEFDPLRDEGNAYAERLRAAGTKVVHREFSTTVHGFLLMGGALRSARDHTDSVIREIGALLAS